MSEPKTFEELYPAIEKVVESFRGKWKFKASVDRDFDDIKNEILVHIWQKWHLYDQSRPVEGWVSTVTNHQFINHLRNIYFKTSSPCNRCASNIGNGMCAQYGTQGVECPLYRKWHGKKRYSHEAKMPLAIDLHINEVENNSSEYFDYNSAAAKLHDSMKEVLTPKQYKIYYGLYVEHKDDEQVSAEAGFSKDSKAKRVRQIKTLIIKKAKELLSQDGSDII